MIDLRLLLATALILGALSLPASEVILKRKAKELSRQNENRSLEPPAQSPARPATPQAPVAPLASRASSSRGAQPQNVQKLVADLAIIKSRSQVTPEQKQKLTQDLQACALGTTKPSPALITKLADDIAASLTNKKLSTQEQAQLARDIAAVLNSASLSQTETLAVIDSAQTILKYSGVTLQDVQTLVADLRSIAEEVQRTGAGRAR